MRADDARAALRGRRFPTAPASLGAGLDVRRTLVRPDECTPWSEVAVATPLRTILDLLLDQPLPDAVADLDAVLRHGLVTLPHITALVEGRLDKGNVLARRAVELADSRAESRPESRVRVWLELDGLRPEPKYWIEDPHGRLARVDLAVPEHKVAVEYDGSWRDGELWALNRDRDRLNRVQAAGWEIVFVTASCCMTQPAWSAQSAPRSIDEVGERDSAPNGASGTEATGRAGVLSLR